MAARHALGLMHRDVKSSNGSAAKAGRDSHRFDALRRVATPMTWADLSRFAELQTRSPAVYNRTQMAMRHALIALALVWLCLTRSTPLAAAQQTVPCGPDLTDAQCQKLERARQLRAAEAERDAAFFAYTAERPWRLRGTIVPSLTVLGLKHAHTKNMWGVGLGFGLQNERHRTALRLEGLVRLGAGPVRDYDLTNNDSSDGRGMVLGAEIYGAFLRRAHPFYGGPVLAAGALIQRSQKIRHVRAITDETFTMKLPAAAAFLATGATLGWELNPYGKTDLGFRFLLGAWDTFRRLYAQAGFQIAVALGE